MAQELYRCGGVHLQQMKPKKWKRQHQNEIDNKNIALVSRSDSGRDTSRIKTMTKISAWTISASALVAKRTQTKHQFAKIWSKRKKHREPSTKIKEFFHTKSEWVYNFKLQSSPSFLIHLIIRTRVCSWLTLYSKKYKMKNREMVKSPIHLGFYL
jgi:hypothetical protein